MRLLPDKTTFSIFLSGKQQPRLLVTAGLLLFTLVYFFPALLGNVALMRRDALVYYVLVKQLVGQMMANGILPLWNPYLFGGTPLLASIQPGVLYPLNWLFAALPTGFAMNVTVIAGYHLSLVGAYLFGRRIGMNRTGAMMAGLGFAYGGFLISQMELTHYVVGLAWAPWILYAIESLYQSCQGEFLWRRAWRWVVVGAICVALQTFAGVPQANFQTLLVAAPYALFCLTVRGRDLHRWRFLLLGIVMSVCGALLSAVQLLPTRELQVQGERSQIPYGFFSMWSMPWRRLIALIVPNFFGAQWSWFYQQPQRDEPWQVTLCHGYIGLAGLLMMIVALLGALRKFSLTSETGDHAAIVEPERTWRKMVWFWFGIALLGLLLAAGDNLPFGLHHWLYRVPVYNFFRCPHRHLFEFSLAASILAGLGATFLAKAVQAEARTVLRQSILITIGLMIAVVILYRFSSSIFSLPSPHPVSLTNRELLVPVAMMIVSLAAAWFYWRQIRFVSSATLLLVLLADLILLGLGFDWHAVNWEVKSFYAETPAAAQLIKAREPDLNAFRIFSYSTVHYPLGYRDISYQNLPIAHGLQSIGGYDPMRLNRLGEIAGQMDVEGTVRDPAVINTTHQGANLLNVKYLLRNEQFAETKTSEPLSPGFVKLGNLPFRLESIALNLTRNSQHSLEAGNFAANELALVSAMANATHLVEGTPVARIRLYKSEGQFVELLLKAGADTSEWSWDRPEVSRSAGHKRAPLADSTDTGEGYAAHRYLARLRFERAAFEKVQIDYLLNEASLVISGITLIDSTTGTARALEMPLLAPERWRRVERSGTVAIYENLKAMPRAWFVSQLQILPRADVLKTIQAGQLPDGSPFDPRRTALFEEEELRANAPSLSGSEPPSNARVEVISYEPNRIRLQTNAEQPGYLVLSEIFYRGWRVRIDGAKAPMDRVNYLLRGLAVPAGSHQIEFIFQPASLQNGLTLSGVGALLLLLGWAVTIRADRIMYHRFYR